MLNILILIISLTIPPLEYESDWTPTPTGMVVVKVEDAWILYSATRVKCSAVSKKNIVLQGEACFLVDPRPVGYYLKDPNDPKNYSLKLHTLTKRTYDHGKNK